jgi:hypothetical protein
MLLCCTSGLRSWHDDMRVEVRNGRRIRQNHLPFASARNLLPERRDPVQWTCLRMRMRHLPIRRSLRHRYVRCELVMPNGSDPTRGNNRQRKARKLWLLATFGDGETCACWECGATVRYETLCVDRITPACDGGTYRRNNIRPHCLTCSCKQGAAIRIARSEILVGRHGGTTDTGTTLAGTTFGPANCHV